MVNKLVALGCDKPLVMLNGWIKSVRKHKSIVFLTINNGSDQNIQATINPLEISTDNLHTGCAISLQGNLVSSLGKEQKNEIKISKILQLTDCNPLTYPFAKKFHSDEHLRKYLHLRMRTEKIQQIMRLNSFVLQYLHEYYQKNNYIHITTSIITSNNCEGGSDAFQVTDKDGNTFFRKNIVPYLTVSGQFQLEAACNAFPKVYTIGPCFRAEKHDTRRHLAEFRMIECELAFVDNLNVLLDEVENCIRYLIGKCNEHSVKINQQFAKYFSTRIPRITYTEAIALLNKSGDFEKLQIGDYLETKHENYLSQVHFNGPYFCTNYPAHQKPFYMKTHKEGELELTSSFDLVVPEFGELCGGSLREDRKDELLDKLTKLNLDQTLRWYVELREFGKTAHGGFGIGFERLLQALSNTHNIQDVLPFPVTRDLLRH